MFSWEDEWRGSAPFFIINTSSRWNFWQGDKALLSTLGFSCELLWRVYRNPDFRVEKSNTVIHESECLSVVSNSVTPWTYTVHGILQARILELVAFPFSRRPFQPRDRTQVSCTAGGFFIIWQLIPGWWLFVGL